LRYKISKEQYKVLRIHQTLLPYSIVLTH